MKFLLRFAGCLSLAALLNGCAVHHAAYSPMPGPMLEPGGEAWVSSPDGSFGVRVPAGWALKGDSDRASMLLVADDGRDGVIVLKGFPTTISPTPAAMAQVRDGVLEGLAQDVERFRLESQKDAQVGGRPAFQVRYRYELKGTPLVGCMTVLAGEQGLYSVNAVSPQDRFRSTEAALRGLLETFRLDEQQAGAPAYVDPEGQFTVTVPTGWTLQDYKARPGTLQSFHTFALTDGSDAVVMVGRMAAETIDPSSSRQVVESIERGLFTRLQARLDRVEDVRPILLGGRPAVLRQLAIQAGEQSFYLYEVVQVSAREVTTIAAYGPRLWLKSHQPMLEAFSGSFEFTGAAGRSEAVAAR